MNNVTTTNTRGNECCKFRTLPEHNGPSRRDLCQLAAELQKLEATQPLCNKVYHSIYFRI
jgi:hypothetical protein